MKILFKHRTRGQAAESVHINGMVNGFKALGCEIVIASPPFVQIGSLNQSFRNKIIRFISLNFPRIVYEVFALMYNFISYYKCNKFLNQMPYDFIYERYSIFDFSTIILKRKRNILVVLEVNGAVSRKVSQSLLGRDIIMKGLACYLENKIFNIVDYIIVISTSLKESLVELGVSHQKILVLPNAIDPKITNNNLSGRKVREQYCLEKKQIIGFVGSFHIWHGVKFLIASLSELLRSKSNVHVLLVGEGHEKENIIKLVEKLKLQKSVTLTGFISHSEIPEYIAAMDICTVPGANDFMSPLKLFEYMLMGKPVVSARYGPIEEVIQNGINGFLFTPHDKNQFEKIISHLINNPELARKIGREGRIKVLNHHTWQSNCSRVVEFIKK